MDKNIKDILDKPLPKEAVKQHPTKTYLSAIKAIYVIERFNEAFGVGGWTTHVELIKHDESNGMVVVKVTFNVDAHNIYYECYGGNDNGGKESKNFDLGDAFKGATTDALTKIGSYLGIGMDVFKGLDNKSQPQQKTTPINVADTWLNITSREGYPTQQWKELLLDIKEGRITTLKQVTDVYKVSKVNQELILKELEG